MSDIVRASSANIKIQRPDGSTFEYSGPPEELSVILSQLNKDQSLGLWAKLEKWHGLIIASGFALFSILLLALVLKPVPSHYQPNSMGGNYGRVA